jgi:hypothetical protein
VAVRYDVPVWERYATELALAFGETTTRIRAVRAAFDGQGFDVDLISEVSGFPVWRVRQAILDASPEPESD